MTNNQGFLRGDQGITPQSFEETKGLRFDSPSAGSGFAHYKLLVPTILQTKNRHLVGFLCLRRRRDFLLHIRCCASWAYSAKSQSDYSGGSYFSSHFKNTKRPHFGGHFCICGDGGTRTLGTLSSQRFPGVCHSH